MSTTLAEHYLSTYGGFMTIEQLANELHLSRHALYSQLSDPDFDIPHMKRGRRYLFPTIEVAGYLQNMLDKTPAPKITVTVEEDSDGPQVNPIPVPSQVAIPDAAID